LSVFIAARAASDVLVRLDADDVMLEGYLRRQFEAVNDVAATRILRTWSILVDEQLKPVAAELFNGRRSAADGKRSAPTDRQFLPRR
jgi:hypothetical protein